MEIGDCRERCTQAENYATWLESELLPQTERAVARAIREYRRSLAFNGAVEAPNIARAKSMDTLFDISDAMNVPAYKFLQFDED